MRAAFMLLVVSAGIHLRLFHPAAPAAWMGSDVTLVIAGILTLGDFFADKIPWVDHALLTVHSLLAPASGGIAAAAVGSSDPTAAVVLGILGAANATGVHGIRATTRIGTSVASLGVLTPVVSFLEDGLAVVSVVIALVSPVVFAVVAGLTTIGLFTLGRKAAGMVRRLGRSAGRGTHEHLRPNGPTE